VRKVWTIPIRYVAALTAAGVCACLAIAIHAQPPMQPDYQGFEIGAPPPPITQFAEAFLVIPGVLAGLPVALTGAVLGIEWITQLGLVLGAAFFWYCVGWHVDSIRDPSSSESPPAIVRWYLSALMILSIVLLPFGVLVGLKLGVHSCANGVPPYWVELLSYGISMFWITLGPFFGWLHLRERREQKQLPGIFRT
jgi:hypothetical protein